MDTTRKAQEKTGLVYERDGALWLMTTEYGDQEDRVMIKGGGMPTHFLPDVAYHLAKWERGGISSPDWLPCFSCDAVGMAIPRAAQGHPETDFPALCGHAHRPGRYSPRRNVVMHTAGSSYGRPTVQALAEFDGSSVGLNPAPRG